MSVSICSYSVRFARFSPIEAMREQAWNIVINTSSYLARIVTIRLKAVETSRLQSDLVNEAVRQSLAEDAEDLGAFEERVSEPLISYDDMLKRLKKSGRI
jgi:hypothetical protein